MPPGACIYGARKEEGSDMQFLAHILLLGSPLTLVCIIAKGLFGKEAEWQGGEGRRQCAAAGVIVVLGILGTLLQSCAEGTSGAILPYLL